jgi:uncharacterized protein (DUF3084 family)
MSPRPTPEELKKAREQKKREQEQAEQERMKEQEQMERLRRQRRREEYKLRIRWEQVSSELNGLYEELDKIYRKAPEEQISNLTVENVNNLIKDTKQIIQGDPYVDRIKEFVPAGDNPEYRDVVMVIRQLRQGLDRFERSYLPEHISLSKIVDELQDLEAEEE